MAAPYVRADRPIIDKDGLVKVIIVFALDAHLKYPGVLPAQPERGSNEKPKEFFQTQKTLALVADYETRYGFKRLGMTSWVGNSVTAYLPAETIAKLTTDPLVAQLSDDSYSNLSQIPSGGWGNSSSGNEWTSWGHQAVNGKVSIGNTGRKIYIIDSGVAFHDDLPLMTRRNVACGGSGTACEQINASLWPEVGCVGHATHVAGIIGAIANDKTIKGVYAGFPNLVSLAVTERQGASNCGDIVAASGVGYALDYIAYDSTQNNPTRLVHIATMSINPGGTGFNVQGQAQPNWQKVKSLTTTIWAYGVPILPGVFFVQSAGNYPDIVGVPHDGVCETAYRPDSAATSALLDDGVMVVSASHNDGGAVTLTNLRLFSTFAGSPALPDYDLPSITFPYSQTGTTSASYVGPCTDIYAPGNLILSTWGMHVKQSPTDNARPTVSSTLAALSYSGSVSFPVVYGAHVNNAFPTVPPLPTQGWAFLSGSSMSAPFVAAAGAWLADVYGYTTPSELEIAVRNNALTSALPGVTAVPVVRLP